MEAAEVPKARCQDRVMGAVGDPLSDTVLSSHLASSWEIHTRVLQAQDSAAPHQLGMNKPGLDGR